MLLKRRKRQGNFKSEGDIINMILHGYAISDKYYDDVKYKMFESVEGKKVCCSMKEIHIELVNGIFERKVTVMVDN